MFQSVLHTQETLQHFTGESFSAAVLDSGASKTVCGETWMNYYKETLSIEDQNSITSEPSSAYFKFGDDRKVPLNHESNNTSDYRWTESKHQDLYCKIRDYFITF